MKNCLFCTAIKPAQILAETSYFKLVYDHDPIQIGHLLIISKAHHETLTSLSEPELLDLIKLEQNLIHLLETNFNLAGVSVIQNNGTIMDEGTHFHVHLVPRYQNDDFWAKQDVQPVMLKTSLLTKLLSEIHIL